MILTNIPLYDGTLLHARFAFRIFGEERILPTGNIIAFRAPMDVGLKGMVDIADIKNEDWIKSEDAINFCWEIPDISGYAGVCFQRLFCTVVGNILGNFLDAKIEIDGDDIFVHREFKQGGIIQSRGKASVSISCTRGSAVLGHLGINLKAGSKAPVFAYSTNLSDENAEKFMIECNNAFYAMTKDIFIATTKVI
jgi:hypothetical protein